MLSFSLETKRDYDDKGKLFRMETPYISQVKAYYFDYCKHNTFGIDNPRLISKGSEKQTSLQSENHFTGGELTKGQNSERFRIAIVKYAVTLLQARNKISWRFPIVFENALNGVVFHINRFDSFMIKVFCGKLSNKIVTKYYRIEGFTSQAYIDKIVCLHNLLHNSFIFSVDWAF